MSAHLKISDNPPLQTVIAWGIITILSIFGIFAPSIFGIDGFDGGFAISTLCFFLTICGIIIIIIYFKRTIKLIQILKGTNLLAHWEYSTEEWTEYADREYIKEKAGKKVLFLIIAGWALFFGIIFMIFDFENGKWVMIAMLALIAIIAFTAWFTAWYNYRQNKRYLGETFITEDAVYINRQLHTWRSLGASLDSVDLSLEKPLTVLRFIYSAPTRAGIQEYTLRVPVPAGQEKTASEIMDYFNNNIDT